MTPSGDDTRQVATRVSQDAWQILQIGLLVEGAATMQQLLRPVVEAYASELAAQSEEQAIKRNAEAYQDQNRGVARLQGSQSGQDSPPAESGEVTMADDD